MPTQSRLLSVLYVRAGEGLLVGHVFFFSLLFYAGLVLVRTVSYALFLTRFSGESLPYIYIAASVVGAIGSYIYLRLNERFALSAVALGTVIGLLLGTILCWVLLGVSNGSWLIFSLPVLTALASALTITLYGNLLGRLFTLQQGKRLFGLLGTGELVATLIAGLAAPALVALLGTTNLLLLAVATYLAALFVFYRLRQRFASLLSSSEESDVPETHRVTGSLLHNRYVQLIMGLAITYTVAAYLVDNIFYVEVGQRYISEDELASFLGVFTGVLGGVTLLTQMLVSGRVLGRYGVRPVLLAGPAATAIWIVPYVIIGTVGDSPSLLFWFAVLANLALMAVDALDSPAYGLLLQTFRAEERTRVQTIYSGVVQQAAMGLAGVILLILYNVLQVGVLQAAYVLVVVMGIWALLAYVTGREYPRQVQRALRQRLLVGTGIVQPDRESIHLIREGLRHSRVGSVLYALELLEQLGPDEILPVGPELLEHPSELVRLNTIRVIERQNLVALLLNLINRGQREPSPVVSGALDRAIAILGGADIVEQILPALDSPHRMVRVGAMTGLLKSGEMESMLMGFERLQAWAQDPDPDVRLLAVEALKDAQMPGFYRTVGRMLGDSDVRVRIESLHAAARILHPRLWPTIVSRVELPQEHEAAMGCVVAGGTAAVPAVRDYLRFPQQPGPQTRLRLRRLARALGRIGTDDSVDVLLGLVDYPDFAVRTQVLRSLRRAGYHPTQTGQVQEWIRTEAMRAAQLRQSEGDILAGIPRSGQAARAAALLSDAIDDAVGQIRRNVFHCLTFTTDPALIKRIEDNLWRHGEGRAAREGRAYARELVDVEIGAPVRGWIQPLLEDPIQLDVLVAQFPQASMKSTQRLHWLACTHEEGWLPPWIQVCALYLLGIVADELEETSCRRALVSPEPIVRELAAWVVCRLNPQHAEILAGLADDPNPQCAALIANILNEGDVGHMLTTVEKAIALKGVELFAHTPDEVLTDLVMLLKQAEVTAGERVLTKGDSGSSMYIVASGSLSVHDGDSEFSRLNEGDIFGEMALLDPAPRSASVTALTNSVLLELEQEPFYELLEDHSDVSRRIMQLLSRRLRATMDLVSDRQATLP